LALRSARPAAMLTWMSHVNLGEGGLDGRGIYASRSFEKGEVVASYELRRLTCEEYSPLPEVHRQVPSSYREAARFP
jgi:hypothetical protein